MQRDGSISHLLQLTIERPHPVDQRPRPDQRTIFDGSPVAAATVLAHARALGTPLETLLQPRLSRAGRPTVVHCHCGIVAYNELNEDGGQKTARLCQLSRLIAVSNRIALPARGCAPG